MNSLPHLRVLLDGFALSRKPRIADVGANPINVPPYADLLAAGGCHVIGFEPQPSAFADLTPTDDETYLPIAVGDGSTIELKIYRDSGFTSAFEPNLDGLLRYLQKRRWGKVIDRLQMSTVALDEAEGLGVVDLLKIDIQGGELAVFANARRVLKDAVVVITEARYYPIYRDEPMLHGIEAELASQGFVLHKFMFNKSIQIPNSQSARLNDRQMRDQLIDGDAVFIRDPAGIDEWSDHQVAMLAVFSASVFASHSLCLFCIDTLTARGRVPADLAARYVDALPEMLRKPATVSAKEEQE